MKISEIVQQPEGRRLEFKEKLPLASDIAKTIVAFANDAGGELYIGIKVFQVQFIRKNVKIKTRAESKAESLEEFILRIISSEPCSKSQIAKQLNLKTVSGNLNRIIKKLLDEGYIEQTLPDEPSSRMQRYILNKNNEIESKAESKAESKIDSLEETILKAISSEPQSKSEIAKLLNKNTVSGNLNRTIKKLLDEGYIEQTIPDKPSSRLQRYKLSPKGQELIK